MAGPVDQIVSEAHTVHGAELANPPSPTVCGPCNMNNISTLAFDLGEYYHRFSSLP
ncbi:hypothetical protein SBA3_1940003 [Candidatus Sulfopaludibacter sp. SbA3]|nr:hypothetical protein SBA3_1940003 [Candidatus Sulfopaludibacter sp. SbA3]